MLNVDIVSIEPDEWNGKHSLILVSTILIVLDEDVGTTMEVDGVLIHIIARVNVINIRNLLVNV